MDDVKRELEKYINPEKAKFPPRFFKTGKGEYGEGDIFIGVTVPDCKTVALKYKGTSLEEVLKLLKSPIHEERLIALFILTEQFRKGDKRKKLEIYDLYLNNTKFINNWDLVDSSAYKIVGTFLLDKERKILYQLAESKHIWERRIAIVSTMIFIRNNQLDDTLKISEKLLKDKHDLIQKAVGWLLRELGKKDQRLLANFIKKHYIQIPRTTLRYAIERFSEKEKKDFLSGKL